VTLARRGDWRTPVIAAGRPQDLRRRIAPATRAHVHRLSQFVTGGCEKVVTRRLVSFVDLLEPFR